MRPIRIPWCVGTTVILAFVAVQNARGDTYTVNTSSDAIVANACVNHQSNCSLRGAILAANSHSGSTINFNIVEFCPSSGCVINLVSALPDITNSMSISTTNFVIQRSSSVSTNFRIFNVTGTVTVNFSGLTIAKGRGGIGAGGGIQNANGTVNVTNCTLRENVGGAGGGIFNNGPGTLNVTDCTFLNNSATAGGAIESSGPMTVKGSTFSGNSVQGSPSIGQNAPGGVGDGGAIYAIGSSTIEVSNSTFSGNSATGGAGGGSGGGPGRGGAIFSVSNSLRVSNCTIVNNHTFPGTGTIQGQASGGGVESFGGAATLRSNIIALNSDSSGDSPDVNGSFSSAGFNLIGMKDGSSGFTDPTDQTGTNAAPLDPKLDPDGLKDNGGLTKTIALLIGSPAIDKGTRIAFSGNLTTDQRGAGFARVFDDPSIPNAAGSDGADIGAFELEVAGPTPTRLANISTRLRVETGDNVLIGGFIVTGSAQKRIMLRALGPSVAVGDRLANPVLELYDSNAQLIASNDNWQEAPNAQEISDSTIAPSNALESAILRNVEPGAYTAIVRGIAGGEGVGLVEVYDLGAGQDSKLANIATRGHVRTGDNVMIGGLIVTGPSAQKVIVRAIGPSLGIIGQLDDPSLELIDGNGSPVAANENWRDTQQAQIEATNIPPSNELESAIVATLPSAAYTAVVHGANGGSGVALVEVYALDQ